MTRRKAKAENTESMIEAFTVGIVCLLDGRESLAFMRTK